MIVLGEHSDDKGTQLENLTRALLEKRGYRNVCRSWIGAGGEEIDVQGEFETPMMAVRKVNRLVCECKAYKSVVNLPEWLKFCGKLFVARQTSNPDTLGCFIALSGVNGNVRGSYDELQEHKASIELITGDDLLVTLRDLHPHIDRKLILESVKKITDRVITESDLAYRDGQVYWVVVFENDAYTVLKADGKPLTSEEATTLCPMIQTSLAVNAYINLQEEVRAKERARASETAVLARLMVLGGKANMDAILDPELLKISEEVCAAAQRLVCSGLIAVHEDGEYELPDSDYKKVTAVFRALLSGPCPVLPLGCKWYDDHINTCLLEEIIAIQRGMRIRDEAVNRVIDAIRMSPSALRAALQPIPMIANGMEQMTNGFVPENVIQGHQNHFIKVMYDSLQMDFMHPMLAAYFYLVRGVRELELKGSYILKSEIGITLQNDYRQRHIVGLLAGSGQGIHMLALDGMAEPWENQNPVNSSE